MNDPEPVAKVVDGARSGLIAMMVVAVLGGAARQAHQILSGKKVSVVHFLLRGIISGFIGLVCYFALPPATAWSFATTGLLSWLGADSVGLLLQVVFRKGDREK